MRGGCDEQRRIIALWRDVLKGRKAALCIARDVQDGGRGTGASARQVGCGFLGFYVGFAFREPISYLNTNVHKNINPPGSRHHTHGSPLSWQAYTSDPASLPVQYRCNVTVKEVLGVPGRDALLLTLVGSRGEAGVGGWVWAVGGVVMWVWVG